MKSIRYVITYDAGNGTRSLAFAAQGRHTFAAREEAERFLRAMRENNSDHRLVALYGPKGGAALDVTEVECYPHHHDPMRSIFPMKE